MNEEWPIGKPLVLSNPYEGHDISYCRKSDR